MAVLILNIVIIRNDLFTHPIDRICLPVQFSQHCRCVQQNHFGKWGWATIKVKWRIKAEARVTEESSKREDRVREVEGVNVKRREMAMREESRKIVIKLSARRRQSRKALIWFNHHEITALKHWRRTNADPPSITVNFERLVPSQRSGVSCAAHEG